MLILAVALPRLPFLCRPLLRRRLRPVALADGLGLVAVEGELVGKFLQEPERAAGLLAPLHLEEPPRAAEARAFEPEAQRARAPPGLRVALGQEAPDVPTVDAPRAVRALGQHALEAHVRERVVGHLDGE